MYNMFDCEEIEKVEEPEDVCYGCGITIRGGWALLGMCRECDQKEHEKEAEEYAELGRWEAENLK